MGVCVIAWGSTLALSPLSTGEGLGVSTGTFALSFAAHPEPGLLEVLDVQGRVVYQHRLAAWSQIHNVALENTPAGLYNCRMQWGTRSANTRVILQP